MTDLSFFFPLKYDTIVARLYNYENKTGTGGIAEQLKLEKDMLVLRSY